MKAGEEDERQTASPRAPAGLVSNHMSDGLAHTCAELATRQALHVT